MPVSSFDSVRRLAPENGAPACLMNQERRVPLYGPAFKDPATGRDPKGREIP